MMLIKENGCSSKYAAVRLWDLGVNCMRIIPDLSTVDVVYGKLYWNQQYGRTRSIMQEPDET